MPSTNDALLRKLEPIVKEKLQEAKGELNIERFKGGLVE